MEENKESFLSDPRNIAKSTTGMLLLGAVGLGVLYYLLPILTTIVWEGVNLIIGLATLATMLYILTSKGTWRRLSYINEIIAKTLTFWIIGWDEFVIQEMAIEKAKQDRNVIKEQADILLGLVAAKDQELAIAHQKMDEAQGLVNELTSQGKTIEDSEVGLYASQYTRQKGVIETLKPQRDDMQELGSLCQKVYKETGIKIQDATEELETQRSTLESLTAGETAMNKTLSIFNGKSKDLILAERLVKEKIGKKIGSIRNTLDIVTPMMNERALRDKVRMKQALDQMKGLSIDGKQITIDIQPKQLGDNRFTSILDINKMAQKIQN
jgi:hypothetical protein